MNHFSSTFPTISHLHLSGSQLFLLILCGIHLTILMERKLKTILTNTSVGMSFIIPSKPFYLIVARTQIEIVANCRNSSRNVVKRRDSSDRDVVMFLEHKITNWLFFDGFGEKSAHFYT